MHIYHISPPRTSARHHECYWNPVMQNSQPERPSPPAVNKNAISQRESAGVVRLGIKKQREKKESPSRYDWPRSGEGYNRLDLLLYGNIS